MNKRVFAAMAVLALVVFIGAAAWLFWLPSQQKHAPTDPGVCWRMDAAGKYSMLVKSSNGIEACAGDLERIHMKTGEALVGAYQGRFIFVDKVAIESSETLTGARIRLYFDNQRDALDKSLNAHDMVFTTTR